MNLYKEIQVPLKFNPTTMKEFRDAFTTALEDKFSKVIVLTGGNSYFSTGIDLEFITTENNTEVIEQFVDLSSDVLKIIKMSMKPVIAKVEKRVIAGGLEFIGIADFVVSSKDVTFCLPEATFKVSPFMVMSSLRERLKVKDIKFLALTSELIGATQALEIGLIDVITDHCNIDKTISYWSCRFARSRRSVVNDTKNFLNMDMNFGKWVDIAKKSLLSVIQNDETMRQMKDYLEGIKLINDEYLL